MSEDFTLSPLSASKRSEMLKDCKPLRLMKPELSLVRIKDTFKNKNAPIHKQPLLYPLSFKYFTQHSLQNYKDEKLGNYCYAFFI